MSASAITQIRNILRQPAIDCGSIDYPPLAPKVQLDLDLSLPLVSIISVTFNAAKTIEQAIRSVAAQRYSNIEYIIIDGGSTDNTLKIIRKNASHVDCLVSESDKGIYDAMNKGLLRAKGEYIAILNADDCLFPEFISQSVRALKSSGADIAYCDYMTENGSVIVTEPNCGIFLSQLGIKHNTFLYTKKCFQEVGGFDIHLSVVADAKWNRCAFAAGLRFVKVPGTHVFYSLHGVSAGTSPTTREAIIQEASGLILDTFSEIDRDQARILYLSNFNSQYSKRLIEIHDKLKGNNPILGQAITEATRWNLRHRDGYQMRIRDFNRAKEVLELAIYFSYPLSELRFENPESAEAEVFTRFLNALETILAARESTGKSVCLHFARKFSSASETFIYDFLKDLEALESEELHLFLCDERLEAESRPHDYVLNVPWDSLPADLRKYQYELIWRFAAPKKIIAHFALNGWFLHERLSEPQRQLPWVNMCHGIDVFAYGDNPNYASYIDTYCALAPNVVFTVVSEFLGRLLHGHGISSKKIFKVPNAVAADFLSTRKVTDFWDGNRVLKIISIGRLIKWKGHDVLLQALGGLREARPNVPFHLTIVYGRWDGEKNSLEALAHSLNLQDSITFIEFVDFRKQASYLSGFDLFVLPSTLSDDKLPRTETFGVAVIEAIAAGLPVIATDAGGIPEVIGNPTPQARIIKHGSVESLISSLVDVIDSPEQVFYDNSAYALERVALFSAQKRLQAWKTATDWVDRPRKIIFHFCALARGGAANASINIHKGFLKLGYDSWFVTRNSEKSHLSPYLPNTIGLAPETSVDFNHSEPPRRPEFTTFTLDDQAISNEKLIQLVRSAHLINLTWPAKFLSVQNIAALTNTGIPVMMTLRDMNQITGGCHFFHGCEQWKHSCSACPQAPDIIPEPFSSLVFSAKKRAWNAKSITYVALSDHSLDILSKSPLSASAQKVKLPNYVDTYTFFQDPTILREAADIDTTTFKVGYLPSFGSRVKGHRELMSAFRLLKHQHPTLKIIVLLASNDNLPESEMPFEVLKIGAIGDKAKLRCFYNTCDVIAVPSLEETFSNTTVEALACGTPVVGFKTGVLGEILIEGECGAVAEVGDVPAYADALFRTLTQPRDRTSICRRIAAQYGWEARMADYDKFAQRLISESSYTPSSLSAEATTLLADLTDAQQRNKSRLMVGRLTHMRARTKQLEEDLKKLNRSGPELGANKAELSALEAEAASAKNDLIAAQAEAKAMRDRVAALESSTSWRITGPMRRIVTAFRRPKVNV